MHAVEARSRYIQNTFMIHIEKKTIYGGLDTRRTLQLRFGQGGGRYGFGFDRYKLAPKGFPQTPGLKHNTGVGGRRTPPYSFLYPLIIL